MELHCFDKSISVFRSLQNKNIFKTLKYAQEEFFSSWNQKTCHALPRMKPVIWIAWLLKCEIGICIRESWWLSTVKLAVKSLGFWWLQKWVFAGWAEALVLQLGLSDPKQLPLNGCLKCESLSTHTAHGPPWERFPSPCEGTEHKKAMYAQLKLFLYQLIELYSSSAAAWQEILLFHAQHTWLLLLPREASAMLQQTTSSEKSFPRHPN